MYFYNRKTLGLENSEYLKPSAVILRDGARNPFSCVVNNQLGDCGFLFTDSRLVTFTDAKEKLKLLGDSGAAVIAVTIKDEDHNLINRAEKLGFIKVAGNIPQRADDYKDKWENTRSLYLCYLDTSNCAECYGD